MPDKEIWKDIEGYEGKYQISNLGRVRSLKDNHGNGRKKPILMKALKNYKGYLTVHLSKKNTSKRRPIHRLVAIAFIQNPHKKRYVNHINGVKTDNIIDNLEWVTAKENTQHAIAHKLSHVGEKASVAKFTNEQVIQIRSEYVPFSREFGCNALARKFGVASSTICSIVNNKSYKE